MMNKSVRQMLESKGFDVWSVEPDTSVLDALWLMAEKGIGAVMVMNGETVVGVLSERDYARKIVLEKRMSSETQVRDIMTSRVVYAQPEDTAEECLAVMTERRVRHLPVVEDDKVIGVISIGDLVKAVISDQRFMIEQLTNYIGS